MFMAQSFFWRFVSAAPKERNLAKDNLGSFSRNPPPNPGIIEGIMGSSVPFSRYCSGDDKDPIRCASVAGKAWSLLLMFVAKQPNAQDVQLALAISNSQVHGYG